MNQNKGMIMLQGKRSYTHFALKLFKAIAQDEPQQNIFVSPLSIAFALAVLYNGATGETRDAIANLLELSGLSLATVNSANAALLKHVHHLDPQITLTLTNRVEVGGNMAITPTF